MAQDWYYKLLGEETGPVIFASLRELATEGHLASDDEVRTSTSSWKLAQDVPGLFGAEKSEEPELATDMDLDLMLAPASRPSQPVSLKRQLQRSAVAAAAVPVAAWYYKILGQEMGPTTQAEILQQIKEGSLQGEDTIRLAPSGSWERIDQTSEFAAAVAQTQPQPEWYCRTLGQEFGPMAFAELQKMAKTGSLHADDDVRHGTTDPWEKADRTRGLKFPKASSVTAVSHDRTATLVPFGDAAKKREWFYEILGQQMGPISYRELAKAVSSGTLTLEDKARRGPAGAWLLVVDVPGLVSTESKAAYLAAKQEASRPRPITPGPVPAAASPSLVTTPPPSVAKVEELRPAPPATAPPAAIATAPRPIPAPTSSGGYGSMASASPPPALPPRPAFTSAKKSSGPGFDFGAMMGDLKEKLDGKGIAAIAVLVLMGIYFGMSFLGIRLGGQPGQTEFAEVKILWTEVQKIHQQGDKAADWEAFKSKHATEVDKLRDQIVKQNPGSETPLLQAMLFCTRDHLPSMLIPAERASRYKRMDDVMTDASQLADK